MMSKMLRPVLNGLDPLITKLFHINYYAAGDATWSDTTWMGARILKNPMDLWMYQELLSETRPDLLIECGTNKGDSAYYFAHLFDLLGNGRVITIDIAEYPAKPLHPRIEYVLLSSTSPECIELVRSRIKPGEKVMVILDSDHSQAHVAKELSLYAPNRDAGTVPGSRRHERQWTSGVPQPWSGADGSLARFSEDKQ